MDLVAKPAGKITALEMIKPGGVIDTGADMIEDEKILGSQVQFAARSLEVKASLGR